jgi:ATP-binding cassette subfamily B protein
VSAGEAQLLAFARALLTDPGLVVLDEASSRLDPATERRVERVVERLLAGRTGVLIAHRLSSLARVDVIAVVDGGRIVEYGRREELAADPDSRFARLLSAAGVAG